MHEHQFSPSHLLGAEMMCASMICSKAQGPLSDSLVGYFLLSSSLPKPLKLL